MRLARALAILASSQIAAAQVTFKEDLLPIYARRLTSSCGAAPRTACRVQQVSHDGVELCCREVREPRHLALTPGDALAPIPFDTPAGVP